MARKKEALTTESRSSRDLGHARDRRPLSWARPHGTPRRSVRRYEQGATAPFVPPNLLPRQSRAAIAHRLNAIDGLHREHLLLQTGRKQREVEELCDARLRDAETQRDRRAVLHDSAIDCTLHVVSER